jgi:DNA topoisomerase VI subunit B
MKLELALPNEGARKREEDMPAQEPHPSEVSLRRIQEMLEQKPDRDELKKWLSKVLFKLGEIHEDVRDLERDLAYVTSQVDELQS